MDLGSSFLNIKMTFESNSLNSRILVRRFAMVRNYVEMSARQVRSRVASP